MELSVQLLQETKQAFANVRGSIVVAMQRLYQVKQEEVWRQVADNWGEYVESELGISQGFASKLLSINNHYILEGGIEPDFLSGIDYEKLNMARTLPGSPEEQVEKARVLTRSELKLERNDAEPVPHTPEWVEFCKVCNVSRTNHG